MHRNQPHRCERRFESLKTPSLVPLGKPRGLSVVWFRGFCGHRGSHGEIIRQTRWCSTETAEWPETVGRPEYTLARFCYVKQCSLALGDDPLSWPQNSNYPKYPKRAQALRGVNDTAELGVSLMSDYNTTLTSDESQKQAILQVVEKCRDLLKYTSKMSLQSF